MSAALITGVQRAMSASTRARNSGDVVGIGVINWVASFSRIAGAVIAAANALRICASTGAGVLDGCDQPHPGIGLDVDSLFLEGRDAGQQRVALARRNCQNLDLTGTKLRGDGDRRQARHLHIAAHQGGHGLR